MEKNKTNLFLFTFIITIVLLRMLVYALTGSHMAQLFIAIVLLVLGIVGIIAYSTFGEKLFAFLFLLSILNQIVWWLSSGTKSTLVLLLSLVGFLLTIPTPKPSAAHEAKPMQPKVYHDPGKYVASKHGNVYHEPKCEWANNIKEDRQVWFESKDAAWEKGYKAHSCIA